jgi:hypothetical protein
MFYSKDFILFIAFKKTVFDSVSSCALIFF